MNWPVDDHTKRYVTVHKRWLKLAFEYSYAIMSKAENVTSKCDGFEYECLIQLQPSHHCLVELFSHRPTYLIKRGNIQRCTYFISGEFLLKFIAGGQRIAFGKDEQIAGCHGRIALLEK